MRFGLTPVVTTSQWVSVLADWATSFLSWLRPDPGQRGLGSACAWGSSKALAKPRDGSLIILLWRSAGAEAHAPGRGGLTERSRTPRVRAGGLRGL